MDMQQIFRFFVQNSYFSRMQYTFFDFMQLMGSLGLFLYGMIIMSEGLQKTAGDGLRKILTAMTTNRVMGVLTGVAITALIQSSSATTVMVVSFVNAGLLTLTQSIGVIMGANIGTTVTAWIISVFGFKVDISTYCFPLFAIALPMLICAKNTWKYVAEFIFGFCFLFMGLALLKANAPDLSQNPEMLDFVQNYTDLGFFSIILFLLIGTLLTMIVQASAATMAITLIMCANGWIDYSLGAALVLGENIGTTITANLAALTANTQSKRAALAHLVFNVFGVLWVLAVFYPFVNAVSWGVDTFLNPTDQDVAVSYKLSAFHTCFNICNVCLLIWFVPLIEKTVTRFIPGGKKDEDDEYRLRFIGGGLLSTSELSILQAEKEIIVYGERTQKMFYMIGDMMQAINKSNEVNVIYNRVKKYENISNNMEVEIANYLNSVSGGHLSLDSKSEIRAMLRKTTEIESIGDSCLNLARALKRKKDDGLHFTEKQKEHIAAMLDLCDKAIIQMLALLQKHDLTPHDVELSYKLEDEINIYRNQLKNMNLADVSEKKYDYPISVIYMDFINECEKLGDYVINVIEASLEEKLSK